MEAKIGVVIHTSLVNSVFSAADRARLNALGEVRWTASEKPLEEPAAIELLRDCTIGVGSWRTPWPSAQLVEACPDLRLWEHVAGTVTRFFGPHLEGRDLTIASCKTAIADNVADVTLAQLIMGIRRLQYLLGVENRSVCKHELQSHWLGTSMFLNQDMFPLASANLLPYNHKECLPNL